MKEREQQGVSTPFSGAVEFVLSGNPSTDAEVFYKPEKFPLRAGPISTMASDNIFKALSSHASESGCFWYLLLKWRGKRDVKRIHAAFSKQNKANFLVCKQSFLLDPAWFYL